MNINKTPSDIHSSGYDRPLFEQDIDAYRSKGKFKEPTSCTQCGAVFYDGRWQWMEAPAKAHSGTCPACQRVNDNVPAGFVTLEGPFLNTHSEEIRHLIQHHAEHERLEHPLKRIISLESKWGAMQITTTDTHLARGIGEAIRHAYQGDLKVDHVPGENMVRVYWNR
jgi:hypothetical protein